MAMPSLCIFGESITPNQHKLADEFVLLDNTYCCGILSADGHQWSTTAFSTDYMEKSFAGFPRSYPDGMGEDENDALAYSPAGFIWDNALKHKKIDPQLRRVHDARRALERSRPPTARPTSMACYRAWKNKIGEVIFESSPSIETIRPFSPTRLRRLGDGGARSVPGRFHSQRAGRVREKGRVSPTRDHLPAQRSHQRHDARLPHAARPASPTTTWPSAALSRA